MTEQYLSVRTVKGNLHIHEYNLSNQMHYQLHVLSII